LNLWGEYGKVKLGKRSFKIKEEKMASKINLRKILKYFLIFLVIGLAVFVVIVFKKEAPKILGIYALLWLKPEFFVLAAYLHGQTVVAVFIQVFVWTTIMTMITWYVTALAQEGIKKIKTDRTAYKNKTLQKIADKTNALKNRYEEKRQHFLTKLAKKSKYLLYFPFAFGFLLIVPGIDSLALILGKVIGLPLWSFIAINAAKFIVIIFLVVYYRDFIIGIFRGLGFAG
jgi:hypothetical protein